MNNINVLSESSRASAAADEVAIRAATPEDVAVVAGLDHKITGLEKPDYWADMFRRYGAQDGRYFLVAETDIGGGEPRIAGFIIGEVRAWEFGSPPSGWVFALGVDPDARLKKIGSQLFDAICRLLKSAGVDTVRTMLARDDELNMTFFRAQGMMGGPFIQLEKALR